MEGLIDLDLLFNMISELPDGLDVFVIGETGHGGKSGFEGTLRIDSSVHLQSDPFDQVD